MQAHPSREQLRQLQEGLLDAEQEQQVAVHVESCEPCQAALDAMTVAGGGETAPRPAEPAGVLPPGTVVSGYEVLSVLGRGGMGVVYKARQAGLNRVVALKMILAGAHAGERDLARFRTEAEAAARFQHPNIVQVHEVGFHDGLPYFSPEFVAGGSLAERLAGVPRPAREAAAMVETLARAVEYAHGQGVVHRDLKPANVLLTADGAPKITDFGLAKRLDLPPGPTRTGAVMGTPSYMPPEQARGESKQVGPAADVYALGAVLYELLTGRPPFKAANDFDTLLQVVADDPAPPRRLQSKTPRDLETICLKCLQKEPSRRFAAAAALADDLRRFVNGEPIRARPVGRAERLWRWCRRRPVLAGLTAALVLVIAVGLAAVVWQWQRAEERSRLAEERFRKNVRTVDDFYTQVSEDVLLKEPGMEPLRKELLTKAAGYYHDFLKEHGDDPALRTEAAQAYLRVAAVDQATGHDQDALSEFHKGLDLFEALARERPDVLDYPAALALGYFDLGRAQIIAGQSQDAYDSWKKSLELYKDLTDRRPDDAEYRWGLVSLWVQMSGAERSRGQDDAAREYEDEAGKGLDALAQRESTGPDHDFRLAANYWKLGMSLASAGRKDRARELFDNAQTFAERYKARRPAVQRNREVLAQIHYQLGNLDANASDPQAARRQLAQALAIQEELTRDHPTVVSYRLDEASTHRLLAQLDQKDGDAASAAVHLARAVVLVESLDSSICLGDLAVSNFQLGTVYDTLGRTAEAEQACQKAVKGLEELTKKDQTNFRGLLLAAAYFMRGRHYQATGRLREAAADYERACEVAKGLPQSGPNSGLVIFWSTYPALAVLHNDEGQAAEGPPLCDKAIQGMADAGKRETGAGATSALQGAYLTRASCFMRLNDLAGVEADLKEASGLDDGKKGEWLRFMRAITAARRQGREPGRDETANYRQAADEAKARESQGPFAGSGLYDQAVWFAWFLHGCRLDPDVNADRRETSSEEYAAHAVQLLARARAIGYFTNPFNREMLRTEPAFASLYGRPDFEALHAAVEAEADTR